MPLSAQSRLCQANAMPQCSFPIAAVHAQRSIPTGGMAAVRTKQTLKKESFDGLKWYIDNGVAAITTNKPGLGRLPSALGSVVGHPALKIGEQLGDREGHGEKHDQNGPEMGH
jgi:hypothetical protein